MTLAKYITEARKLRREKVGNNEYLTYQTAEKYRFLGGPWVCVCVCVLVCVRASAPLCIECREEEGR